MHLLIEYMNDTGLLSGMTWTFQQLTIEAESNIKYLMREELVININFLLSDQC